MPTTSGTIGTSNVTNLSLGLSLVKTGTFRFDLWMAAATIMGYIAHCALAMIMLPTLPLLLKMNFMQFRTFQTILTA